MPTKPAADVVYHYCYFGGEVFIDTIDILPQIDKKIYDFLMFYDIVFDIFGG